MAYLSLPFLLMLAFVSLPLYLIYLLVSALSISCSTCWKKRAFLSLFSNSSATAGGVSTTTAEGRSRICCTYISNYHQMQIPNQLSWQLLLQLISKQKSQIKTLNKFPNSLIIRLTSMGGSSWLAGLNLSTWISYWCVTQGLIHAVKFTIYRNNIHDF